MWLHNRIAHLAVHQEQALRIILKSALCTSYAGRGRNQGWAATMGKQGHLVSPTSCVLLMLGLLSQWQRRLRLGGSLCLIPRMGGSIRL